MNSILKIWRAMLPPKPSARPTFSLPPVPVSHLFSFQHFSARSSSTGFEARATVARAMFLARSSSGSDAGAAEALARG